MPPITLTHSKILAAFSTRSHGLRKIMFTDLELRLGLKYKQRFGPSLTRCILDRSVPFDDPEAQNCMAFIDADDRYLDSSYVWTDEAAVVNRELNKLVTATGKTVSHACTTQSNRRATNASQTEWPVVLTTIKWKREATSKPHQKSVIVYKIPGGVDAKAFTKSLHSKGLSHDNAVICTETPDGTFRDAMNEWWHHFFLQLPKKQKYW